MPLSISNYTGDGIAAPLIAMSIQLPDAGTSVVIEGLVQAPGSPPATVSGSPLTAPSAPGSGSVFWAIEVNTSTGLAQVIQSTVSMPTADPGNVIVFGQTLVPGAADPAANATDGTPDDR